MSVYDLMASELREQRALAIQVIERQNELAESLSQQLQDARAWARLWKRAAKGWRIRALYHDDPLGEFVAVRKLLDGENDE